MFAWLVAACFFFLIHNFGFCILQVLFRGMVSALYARLYVGFWHE